jgi:RHS repeat-associated protein
MKKTLFLTLLFYASQISFSQCDPIVNSNPINRGVLAGLIFELLYEDNTNVYDYEASSFPNPFIDLQENTELNTKLKVLSFLQYDNGLTVYNYTNDTSFCFKPDSPITKIEALIYIMEAWNIHPDFSGSSSPYNDVPNNSIMYGYVNKAHDEGITGGGSNFYPYSILSIGDATEIICSVYNSSFHPVNENLTDIDNYFIPGLFSPENLSYLRGFNQGVFNHYAKDSFVIPDRKLSLNFSHFYSSAMIELPEGFFPIKPLGRGWSHTYNSYIIKENNVGNDSIDYYYIVWPDGTIHIYNKDDNEYLSNGVYDELDELSGNRIRITHKDQSRHYYKQLDNDREIWYLVEIQDANGNEITIEYESAEENDTRRIEYVEAPSGKQLEFRYENNTDLIERIEDPIGRRIHFEYSDLWQGFYYVLVNFEDAKNNDTTYQYFVDDDARQYLLRRIDLPRGNQIHAEYDNDNNGKLSSYQVNNDDPITIDVDFDHNNSSFTSEIETPIPGTSNPFTENYEINENGLITDYSSDTNNLTVDYPSSGVNITLPTETNYNGVLIDYEYDNDGNITEIDKNNGDVVEEFEYDNDNNLTEYTDPEGNTTQFIYDNDTNLIEITDPYNNSTILNYDTYGQLTSKTNQEGITVNYTYESDGALSSITAPEGINSNFSYDGINRLEERIDNGLTTTYQYDDNDNIIQIINSGGFATNYSYDENDNLTNILNANNISTSFEYDNQDRVIEEQFGTLVTQFDYGDEGYLEEITKPSGLQKDFDYDNDGRLDETETITDIDYNSRNLISSVTNAAGTMDFDYDNLNRLEEVTTVHGFKIEYDYEDTGLVDEITYPTINGIQVEVRYSYDQKNRIWQVILEDTLGHGGLVIAEYEYYDDDRIKWIDLANDVRITYGYDSAGRLNSIDHRNNNTNEILYEEVHLLDNRGNITSSSISPLTEGNPSIPSSNSFTYSYNDNNHLTSAETSYNIDTDGNTSSIGADINIIFDVEDRLTNYSNLDNNLEFIYNAYNQRVQAVRNNTITNYIRDTRLDNVLVELDSSNTPLHFNIYSSNGVLLARMKSNGSLQYYHGDIRGSVVMMTNENTNITHQYRYDDFGTVIDFIEPQNDFNSYRYVGTYGVEYELENLYYMRARYYRPIIGRFLSEDPIWHTNLYPYADNNPISKIDPKGNIPVETVLDVASIGVSAAEFGIRPTWENAGYLAWDVAATAIPYVPGSYIRRVNQIGRYGSDFINTAGDLSSYITKNKKLPDNFITKTEARNLGWNPKKGNLDNVAPGKSIGGDIYHNNNNMLPSTDNRIWYEADLNYKGGYRGAERLIYSNDGLIYKTLDHYKTFIRVK